MMESNAWGVYHATMLPSRARERSAPRSFIPDFLRTAFRKIDRMLQRHASDVLRAAVHIMYATVKLSDL